MATRHDQDYGRLSAGVQFHVYGIGSVIPEPGLTQMSGRYRRLIDTVLMLVSGDDDTV